MEAATAIGGIIGLILMLLGIFVSIVWIVFPFLILGKANRMIAQNEEIKRALEIITYNQQKQSHSHENPEG